MTLQERLFTRIGEDWSNKTPAEVAGFIRPKVVQTLGGDQLEEALARKLRIKFGIDPTSSQIHIGHIVPMLLLSVFQKAGHHIDFIVGDFTAMVGDPAGRDTGRMQLTRNDIEHNLEGFINQAARYIDVYGLTIRHNSQWLDSLSLKDLFVHIQKINASTAMQREDFRKRAENGQSVSLAELLYGVLMGFDSLELNSDVELGGVDQLINIAQCREMMVNAGLKPEIGLFTPIIEGTDGSGRKMSKSYGNTISVEADAKEKFGKVMSIPDKLIVPWFKAFTYIHESELPELEDLVSKSPFAVKKMLAVLMIALETKNLEVGQTEQEKFEAIFSENQVSSEDCVQLVLKGDVFITLRQGIEGASELRRLFAQKAVRTLDGRVLEPTDTVTGMIRVGKRRFFNIIE